MEFLDDLSEDTLLSNVELRRAAFVVVSGEREREGGEREGERERERERERGRGRVRERE